MTEVAACLAAIPLFRGRRATDFTVAPLAGLTNRSHVVALDGERYVLRIPGDGTGRYIDRDREHHNASLAAALGIGPAILWRDGATGASLVRYVDRARPLAAADLRRAGNLEAAVDLLRTLHSSAAAFRGKMEPFEVASRYTDLAGRRTPGQPRRIDAIARLGERARELLAATAHRGEAVACHCDPVPENFVGDGARLWLIDWEYSSLGDPMWDLAYLACEADLGDAGRDRVLERYFEGAPGDAVVASFSAHAALVALVGLAWTAAQITLRGPAGGFEADFERRLACAATLGLLRG